MQRTRRRRGPWIGSALLGVVGASALMVGVLHATAPGGARSTVRAEYAGAAAAEPDANTSHRSGNADGARGNTNATRANDAKSNPLGSRHGPSAAPDRSRNSNPTKDSAHRSDRSSTPAGGSTTSTTPTTYPASALDPALQTGGVFAPYVDTLLYPPYDIFGASKQTGTRIFNLAFVVAGNGCTPTWGGNVALGGNPVAAKIATLRQNGGDARVSFGGANGTELAQACTSESSLKAAYQKVIDAYQLTRIDLDIEGAALTDTAANTRRARAIASLQKANPHLTVSYTLPVLPSGLTPDGVATLKNARTNGVRLAAINVMAMDYGDSAAPNPSGKMGAYAIRAVTSTKSQLVQAFGWTETYAFHHLAVTPMIGVNDVATETFTVRDATTLRSFVKSKGLAWVSMWSATRDKPCPGGAKTYADPTCSSTTAAAFAYAKALHG